MPECRSHQGQSRRDSEEKACGYHVSSRASRLGAREVTSGEEGGGQPVGVEVPTADDDVGGQRMGEGVGRRWSPHSGGQQKREVPVGEERRRRGRIKERNRISM